MQWAMTQNNLGGTLMRLGERGNSTTQFEDALAAFNDALAVFIAASAIYYVEVCWENRDRVIAVLAERRGVTAAQQPPQEPDPPVALAGPEPVVSTPEPPRPTAPLEFAGQLFSGL
jgi:hypothetical protein